MERFWLTLDHAGHGSCSDDTVAYISVNWRAPDAIIEESISGNLDWSLNPNKSVLISRFRYYPLNIQIERRTLKRLLYPFDFW
jgi:hypothetical protein